MIIGIGNTIMRCGGVVTPALPTGLTLTLISGGVQIDFTDNSGGLAQTEIWGRSDSGVSALLYTIGLGIATKDDNGVIPVDLRYYKLRSLKNGLYSAFTAESSIAMLSAEMMPAASVWGAVGGAWWNWLFQVGCTGDGSKLIFSSGSPGVGRTPFWTIGNKYRVISTLARTSGDVGITYSGVPVVSYNASGTYTEYFTPTGSSNFAIQSYAFVGNVSALSCKEILMP